MTSEVADLLDEPVTAKNISSGKAESFTSHTVRHVRPRYMYNNP